MRQLSVIIIVLFLVFLTSCKYFRSEGLFGRTNADTDLVLKVKHDSTRVADSLRKVQELEMALENEKLEAARKADEEKMLSESRNRFNIIVGSFSDPEYANRLADDYIKRGYIARVIKLQDKKIELVSAESYESLQKAMERLKEFRETVYKDAWIYSEK